MIKVLSFPTGNDGCSYYRVRKPLEGIKLYTDHDSHIIDPARDDMNEITKIMPLSDIVWLRPGAEKGRDQILNIPEMKQAMKNVRWVMDIDDNLELVSPYSEFYRHNGLEEYSHNGVKIWEDGKNGFDLDDNRRHVMSQIQGMRDADLVVTTTEKLAEYAKQYNPNVYVNDNTIDFRHWWPIKHKKNKRLRILWAGSPSHYEDFYPIKDPLRKLLGQYDIEIYMVGSSYNGIFKGFEDKVKNFPWVAAEAHSYRLMSLTADIGIVPLADNVFNNQKSAIKFYEFSAMALPSVVSNVTPYKEVANHGNALTYSNPDEFYTNMVRLIESPRLRASIGKKAYNWVLLNKNLKIESNKLIKRLIDLCQKK